MRGHQNSAIHLQLSEAQRAFRALSRHRRSKLARVADTTLVKADQWGRGGAVSSDLAVALEGAFKAFKAKNAPSTPKKG
jgi:hypothetical protein